MYQTSISHLKGHLSAEIKKVKRGAPVIVLERNVPVAKIVPLSAADKVREGGFGFSALVEEGVLAPPSTPPERLRRRRFRPVPSRKSALQTLLEEREESRW